jgi:hypothetical protein
LGSAGNRPRVSLSVSKNSNHQTTEAAVFNTQVCIISYFTNLSTHVLTIYNLAHKNHKEQFHVEVSNRFAALEDLDAEVESSSAQETIRENIKISAKDNLGYYELKRHKPWFDEGCSKLLDQRKEAKLQWLQALSEINGDNMNNVRRDAS